MQALLVTSVTAWTSQSSPGLVSRTAPALSSGGRAFLDQRRVASGTSICQRLASHDDAPVTVHAVPSRAGRCSMAVRGKPVGRRSKQESKRDSEPVGPVTTLLQAAKAVATGTAALSGALVIAVLASLIIAVFAALAGTVLALFAVSA